ncbi:hypothetical protein M378DRAFT_166285 [Amanita muscaria Koide BX008]|uniref:Uncharacterized protein n=1 Tax=Amanita muscaria (strain Koide BX008) TaxID=946122 RepID=A0A0C2T5X6_AMAMK|nr:hypothetical protein M378DRAFT_166285 [Amanita muscaria Koide BX008]
MAGPSNTRRISGLVPGLLDLSQPERLFRLPGSRLQFASFDPLAATAQQDVTDFRKFTIDGKLCRPKRIVIEITPSGDSFWRYVPNALLDDGVEDEGGWPRHVEICGDMIECSQDQWDIYKLDPLYECRVRNPPYIAQITRATETKIAAEDVRDDMMDVEAMDVDELPPTKDGKETDFPKAYRAERKVSEHNGGRMCKGGTSDGGDVENFPNVLVGNSQHKKRRLADIPESPSTLDDFSRVSTREQHFTTSSYTTVVKGKRARTASPTFLRRELRSKLLGREKLKRQRREQDFLVKQQKREENLFKDLMADAAQQMRE